MSASANTAIRKPDYGIDAPGLVKMFFFAGSGAVGVALIAFWLLSAYPMWRFAIVMVFSAVALYLLGMGCFMIFGSKIMKVRGREKILGQVAWRGDEHVLDVGCGRGLMLVAAAKRLTTGKAIGIDIWQASDQSSNMPEGAMENARLEDVADRVSINTGDMRALPYPDDSFDVVVSHWVVHNLSAASDRSLAISEMVRVLRPGGQLVLTDIENRTAYSTQLKSLGLDDLRVAVDTRTDPIVRVVSFGSFAPATHYARKAQR